MNKSILLMPVIAILLIGITSAYAESNEKRYNDGYNNGYDAASNASVYDVTCDPSHQFTSDGKHTQTYCDGWTNGYNEAWNSAHSYAMPYTPVAPVIGQSQSQSPGALAQGQGQGSSNTCINVVNCNPSTTQGQDESGKVNNGQ